VTLSSFCESWGVTFDALVRQHTLGQLVLLSMGNHILGAELEDEMDVETPGKHGASDRVSHTPPKPFKKMTSREYLGYLDTSEK